MEEQERVQTLETVVSVIQRCERVKPKFAPGTAQHTLLERRIKAMEAVLDLLEGGRAQSDSDGELMTALKAVESTLRKCEKARSHHEPDTAQYRRYEKIVRAMERSRELIARELRERQA